jgi:hypothetical protein
MSYTKRQIVEAAMAEIGLASYSFDLMPEQYEAALRRLDSMLAEWNGRGLRLGYSIPDNPANSDIDADSGIPDAAWEAAITNLALKMAPSFGKMVNPETKISARHALNTVFARFAMPREQRLPAMPAGAGNKNLDNPFLPQPEENLVAGPDSTLDFN